MSFNLFSLFFRHSPYFSRIRFILRSKLFPWILGMNFFRLSFNFLKNYLVFLLFILSALFFINTSNPRFLGRNRLKRGGILKIFHIFSA